MDKPYKITETILDRGNVRDTDETYFSNMLHATLAYDQIRILIISDITHLMGHIENQHMQYSIKLIDIQEGLVLKSFAINFNQNTNVYKK